MVPSLPSAVSLTSPGPPTVWNVHLFPISRPLVSFSLLLVAGLGTSPLASGDFTSASARRAVKAGAPIRSCKCCVASLVAVSACKDPPCISWRLPTASLDTTTPLCTRGRAKKQRNVFCRAVPSTQSRFNGVDKCKAAAV